MVVVDVTYTRQDFTRASRRYIRERTNLVLDCLLVVTVLGYGGYRAYSGGFGSAFVPLSAACLLSLGFAYLWYVWPYLTYRRGGTFRQPQHMVFSGDGVESSTRNVVSRLQWPAFKRVIADRHSFLLFWDRNDSMLVPVRALTDSGQLAEFERLIERNVGLITRR